jgi:hypothetical protein
MNVPGLHTRLALVVAASAALTLAACGDEGGTTPAAETLDASVSDASQEASDAAQTDGDAAMPEASGQDTAIVEPDATEADASEAGTSDSAAPPVDGGAALIFVGDFEAPGDFEYGGTYSQYSNNVDTCEHDKTCTTDSLAIVTSPVRGGSRAVRVTLKAGDVQDTSGTRAEIQTGSHYDTTLEEDFWYGWSIQVPVEWETGTDQKIVHQWHTGGNNPGGSPIIGLRIVGGAWRITREFEEGDTITVWQGGPVDKGVWTDWVMHIRWSPSTTGHFTAWMNGTQIHTEDGQNMNAGTTTGEHYQKLGMYGSFSGPVTERTLYYDEVRVAKGLDGYALVKP